MSWNETETLRQRARAIHERLIQMYGAQQWTPSHDSDPIATLVNTILSQNTNDRNRDLAYQRLLERFPTWEALRDGPVEEIVQAIKPAGLAPTKAPRIQHALQTITARRGELSLEFLRDMPLEEARSWLLSLEGVGPKTAAIVLLFSLRRPAFPVDTHIHRVTQRLGLIPQGTSREKAHELLEKLLPKSWYHTFHLNVIEHGRRVCTARNPHCNACKLQDLCEHYQTHHTHP